MLLNGGPLPASGSPSPRPYPASVVPATDSTGSVVATVKAEADGSYHLELAPGTYTMKARPTLGNPWFMPEQAVVPAGTFVHADLVAEVP